jgi:hypothetical protein
VFFSLHLQDRKLVPTSSVQRDSGLGVGGRKRIGWEERENEGIIYLYDGRMRGKYVFSRRFSTKSHFEVLTPVTSECM